MTMSDLINFFISYWLIIAVLMSIFWGTRVLHASLLVDWRKQMSRLGYFYEISYQFIFHFVGSFAGWTCFYFLLIRTQNKVSEPTNFDMSDFILFLFSILGLTGHLPQTLYGLVVSIGKFAEAGTSKILGEKSKADIEK